MAKTVLLIEDDEDDRRIFHNLINPADHQNFDIRFCTRISQSLEIIKESRPNLVLLDLNLPDSRGLDTLRKLRGWFPDLAIVVLTGEDDSDLVQKARQEGVEEVLIKSEVTVATFKSVISNALG